MQRGQGPAGQLYGQHDHGLQASARGVISDALGICITGFAKLSTELCDQVVLYLDLQDLIRVIRVSRPVWERLQPIFRQTLYRTINLICCADWEGGKYRGLLRCDRSPRCDLLLRSILRTPDLASFTETFKVHFVRDPLDRDEEPLQPPRLSDVELNRAAEVGTSIDPKFEAEHISRFLHGHIDVSIGLALSLMNNLGTLILPCELISDGLFIPSVVKRSIPSFQFLRHVDFYGPSDGPSREQYRTMTVAQFLPIFYAPAVETVSLILPHVKRGYTNSQLEKSFEWPFSEPPLARNLKVLRLVHSRAPELYVGRILSCCPSLEVLEWDYVCIDTYRPHIDLLEMGKALEPLKKSLQTLKLQVNIDSDEAGDPGNLGSEALHGTFGDVLSRFSTLRHLEIAPVVLQGYFVEDAPKLIDVLPSSLESLSLREDLNMMYDFEWNYDEDMEAEHPVVSKVVELLSGDWKQRMPCLKSIELQIDTDPDLPGFVHELERTLAQLSREHGLQLSSRKQEAWAATVIGQ